MSGRIRHSGFVQDFKRKFGSLMTHTKVIASHTISTLDRSKGAAGVLDRSYHEMKRDFKKDAIKESLGDWLFAEDYPAQLWTLVENLDHKISKAIPSMKT